MMGSARFARILGVSAVVLLSSSIAVAAAMQQAVTPVNQLSIYDAHGRLLGAVVDAPYHDAATVFVRVGTRTMAFLVYPTHLFGYANTLGPDTIWYQSTDCTGQRYFRDWSRSYPGYPLTVYGSVYYMNGTKMYERTGPDQAITAYSYLQADGVTCGQYTYSEQPLTPIAEFLDLSTEFRPPFSVR